jgi:hypothetical protein
MQKRGDKKNAGARLKKVGVFFILWCSLQGKSTHPWHWLGRESEKTELWRNS